MEIVSSNAKKVEDSDDDCDEGENAAQRYQSANLAALEDIIDFVPGLEDLSFVPLFLFVVTDTVHATHTTHVAALLLGD